MRLTDAQILRRKELMTDPDMDALADKVIEYLDTDDDIQDRVEDIMQNHFPNLPYYLEGDSEAGLDSLAEAELEIRFILERILLRKLREHMKPKELRGT